MEDSGLLTNEVAVEAAGELVEGGTLDRRGAGIGLCLGGAGENKGDPAPFWELGALCRKLSKESVSVSEGRDTLGPGIGDGPHVHGLPLLVAGPADGRPLLAGPAGGRLLTERFKSKALEGLTSFLAAFAMWQFTPVGVAWPTPHGRQR